MGIRVIMPVREGYLDDQPATALYASRNPTADMDDLALFIRHQLGGSAALAGHSMGAAWAIDFASRHSGLISKLLLLSPHFASGKPVNSRFFGPFLAGLESLANRPGLYRYIAWQFRRYFVDPTTVRRVLRRLFDASAEDIKVLEGHMGVGPAYDWFAEAYRSSIVGIAEDISAGMRSAAAKAGPLDVAVTIIRSSNDPVGGPAEPAELAHLTGSIRLKTLPQGGHLVAASRPREMWQLIDQELTAPTRPPDLQGPRPGR